MRFVVAREITGGGSGKVMVTGTTEQAKKDSAEFQIIVG